MREFMSKKDSCFVCGKCTRLMLSEGARNYCEPCGRAKMDYELRKLDYRLFRATKAWEKERKTKGLSSRELELRNKVIKHFNRCLRGN